MLSAARPEPTARQYFTPKRLANAATKRSVLAGPPSDAMSPRAMSVLVMGTPVGGSVLTGSVERVGARPVA